VFLTFDAEHPDRPTDATAERRLLDTLAALDVRATFFLQGRWVEAHPDLAGAVVAGGHLLGNHGFYHARMPLLSDEGLRTDIDAAERVILEVTGVDPKPWFRCPFGAGGNDPRVLAALTAAGYRHVGWDVEAEDWEPSLTGRAIAETLVNELLARRGAGGGTGGADTGGADTGGAGTIVLLHSWPTGTADAMPELVTRLRDEGATLERLDFQLA
jgi:peptidoglycan/xylan/chitin deacetylase (PgdA/CDA1 family)